MTTPVFTPSALPPAELDALTVGRAALFTKLVRRIVGAARDGSRPHTLLVAPRGMGKTHTLHVAVNRALADPATAKNVLPVFIPEDALAIGSYLDILVEIARVVGIAQSARSMRRDKDAVGIEQAILAAAADRMVLLVIENLDRVFDSLGSDGQGNLRAWVETSTAITLLASSPALFPGVSSRSHPWYGSFMVETLPDLELPDVMAIIAGTARRRGADDLVAFVESPEGTRSLADIYALVGGAPRPWHQLAQVAGVATLEAVTPAVAALLDSLVPNYQRQLAELSPGELRLVAELARADQPRTVSDLAAAVGVSNQSAATALGRLSASRWVTSAKKSEDRRATWYSLTDPLLRQVLRFRDR
ncbi:MarR family transcriptional regulator [Mycobacterium sp. MS1601]|uniref:MarR family transcriptional regulator n=1 Tax=Mycobacterium sp. MS1601 TaxID=1936029 RepID=UPI0009795725|nr:MarR family transcriptional regulator [Mycobacterium sp. MS1601]AQA02145.1 MarR family transcriptional regulator [Mycobacterium sp. MS1601]